MSETIPYAEPSNGSPPPSATSWLDTYEGREQLWRELARTNPAYLGEYALDLPAEPLHLEWHDLASQHDRLIVIAHPESGKTIQLQILRSLHELGHDPDLRIALIGETSTPSVRILAKIRDNIEQNPRVQEVYPNLIPARTRRGPVLWHQNAVTVQRTRVFGLREKEPSVQAVGVNGPIMGARVDRAFIDDTITFRNALTNAGREKHWGWTFGVLSGRLTAKARVIFTQNAWHEDDTVHRLEREFGKVWHVVRFNPDEDKRRLRTWPEERYAKVRETMDSVEYARQFLGVPLGAATNLLPIDAVRECQRLCDDPPEWWAGEYDPDHWRWITMGIDLGASKRRGSNLTALFVEGLDRQGRKHLLHLRSGLWLGVELLRQVIEVYRSHRPREILVETQAAQLHVAEMLGNEEITRACGATKQEASEIKARMWGQYTTDNIKDVQWGIRGMAADFEASRWRVPQRRREVEEWIGEMRRYSLEEHPGDRLVAGWLADVRMKGRGTPLQVLVSSR